MVWCAMTTSTASLPASSNILASDKALSCQARRAAAKTKAQLALAESHIRKAGASTGNRAKRDEFRWDCGRRRLSVKAE